MSKLSLLLVVTLLTVSMLSVAQTETPLKNQPPDGAGIGFLLTDGTVIFQGNNLSDWWKLTPNKSGSYVNGTWSQIASLPSGYLPDAFASAVLADGRVIIEGGEYEAGNFALTDKGAIYDPIANTWTSVAPPAGWDYIGDSPSAVLPDGTYLLGKKLNRNIAVLDPKTLVWTELNNTGKRDFNAEEGWTLLPDGSVLTADVKDAPHSERYIPSQQEWVSAGSTIVDLHSPSPFGCIPYGPNGKLCYYPPGEIGPQMLRPDGTVFVTGSYTSNNGAGHTAIYTPAIKPGGLGKWVVGPDFPNGDNAGDSFAALLTNGNVLVQGDSGTLYEFNGTKWTTENVAGGSPILDLPTGETLVIGFNVAVYTSTGTYRPSWAPKITAHPKTVTGGSTYKITGQQFNGLSQAAAFGDEFQTNTNYPLVRITNNATKHVFYARTHDHSTMGVATGTTSVYTFFDVPSDIETGASTLEVVANGIPSPAVSITVN
ncbi:MAG TPA: hypothetical protein VF753_02465 [Terriglobales bacterium]